MSPAPTWPVLDANERRVTLAGTEIRLTPKEFEMLKYLAGNSGKVVTHRKLLQAVWGIESTEQTEYLHVRRARELVTLCENG